MNTQLTVALMGSKKVLNQVNALVENYNSSKGTAEASWTIINRIIFAMRCDLGGKGESQAFAGFTFPIIVTDVSPERSERKKTLDLDKPGGDVA